MCFQPINHIHYCVITKDRDKQRYQTYRTKHIERWETIILVMSVIVIPDFVTNGTFFFFSHSCDN